MLGSDISRRWLSPANLLSLSRFGLGAAVWAVIDTPWAVLGIVALAAATDLLDGWVARRGLPPGAPTPGGIGAWLDPLCDKVFVAALVAAVWVTYRPAVYVALLIGARELLQVPLVLTARVVPALRRRCSTDYRAAVIGKLTTVFQLTAVIALLLGLHLAIAAAWLAGALGLTTVAYYVHRAWRPDSPAAPRGLRDDRREATRDVP